MEGAWRWALAAAKDTGGITGEAVSAGQEGGERGQHRRGRCGWCEKILEGSIVTGC
jgi:hypothetical protein